MNWLERYAVWNRIVHTWRKVKVYYLQKQDLATPNVNFLAGCQYGESEDEFQFALDYRQFVSIICCLKRFF